MSDRSIRLTCALLFVVLLAITGLYIVTRQHARETEDELTTLQQEAAIDEVVRDLMPPFEALYDDRPLSRRIEQLRVDWYRVHGPEKVVGYQYLREEGLRDGLAEFDDYAKSSDNKYFLDDVSYLRDWRSRIERRIRQLENDLREPAGVGIYFRDHPEIYHQRVEPHLIRLSHINEATRWYRKRVARTLIAFEPMSDAARDAVKAIVMNRELGEYEIEELRGIFENHGRQALFAQLMAERAERGRREAEAARRIGNDVVYADAEQRVDTHGDPLPPGALARLGTARFYRPVAAADTGFTPDGQAVWSVYGDGVRVTHDRTSGRRLSETAAPEGTRGYPRFVTPDGRFAVFVTTRHENELAVVDFDQEKIVLRTTTDDDFWRSTVAISPDGQHLAMFGKDAVRIWQVDDRAEFIDVEAKHAGNNMAMTDEIRFSPDGSLLISELRDRSLAAWRVADGKQLFRTPRLAEAFKPIAVSDDGRFIAKESARNEVFIFNSATGETIGQVPGQRPVISRDGRWLALQAVQSSSRSSYRMTGVAIYSLPNLELIGKHDCELLWRAPLTFSPDGDRLLVCVKADRETRHTQLIMLETATAKADWTNAVPVSVERVAFSPDGRHILVRDHYPSIPIVLDAEHGKVVRQFDRHFTHLSDLSVPRSGSLAYISDHHAVHIWDMRTGRRVGRIDGRFYFTAVHPAGNALFTADRGGLLTVRDPYSGEARHTMARHEKPIEDAAFTSNRKGELLYTASQDNTIRMWSLSDQKYLTGLYAHDNSVLAIDVDPTGDWLASVDSGHLRVWDRDRKTTRMAIDSLSGGLRDVAIDPKAETVITCDGVNLNFYSIEERKHVRQVETPSATMLDLTPDGRFIVTGGDDGIVRVYRFPDAEPVLILRGHEGKIRQVLCQGRRVISTAEDLTGLVWDLSALYR
jgi:WD40 repeat protein